MLPGPWGGRVGELSVEVGLPGLREEATDGRVADRGRRG